MNSLFFVGGIVFVFPVSITATYLQCHSCSGKTYCESLITRFPQRIGRCRVNIGQGKCFVRKDPNNLVYWGCADDALWPGVSWRSRNGCHTDWDRGWQHNGVQRPITWCFCDQNDCNISIEQVNNTNWDNKNEQTTSSAWRQTQTTDASPSISTTQSEVSQVTTKKITAACPQDFLLSATNTFCYKVVSPTVSTKHLSRDYSSAWRECRKSNSSLVSIESKEKQQFMSSVLNKEPKILDGWQGWWTSGKFLTGTNQFSWQSTNKNLPDDSQLWGFRQIPVKDTCIWIMSISIYQHLLANYDCKTRAGYVCEVQLEFENV